MRKESLLTKIVGWAIAAPIIGSLAYFSLNELAKDDYGKEPKNQQRKEQLMEEED